MNRFDPPGFVEDFTEEQKLTWSQTISDWIDTAQLGHPDRNDGPRTQFFNPLRNPAAADQKVAVIFWNAFPRKVKSAALSDRQRWRQADATRNVQDEYCEWSVMRDPVSQKITRVTFTCEGPEYWDALAEANPAQVLALYQEFISSQIQHADLFLNGQYNKYNRFNNSTTAGAMHLIQGANSLTAEIELGAAATIRRTHAGQELTGAQELIACARYGEAGRNSDPFIGEQINALARQGADITLNNPVGLYLHEFNPVGWSTPDQADAREFWKFVRGRDGYFVRAVFEVPAERGYAVGDITIAGKPLEFGAQIADFITIKLEGVATRIGQSAVVPNEGCVGKAQPTAIPLAMTATTLAFSALPGRLTENAIAVSADATTNNGTVSASEAELIAQLPEGLRWFSVQEESEVLMPLAAPLPYPSLPAEAFFPRMVSGRIMAYASPDSTFAVTKRLIDAAQSSIVIGIYDFNADYIKEQLKQAMRRGVQVALMLDTNHADDPALFEELAFLGATCVKSPSASAHSPNAYFGNAHEKIIVVDREIVMIQSGNWSENSIPHNEGDGVAVGQFMNGNRDMGLAIESKELAIFFADLVARDMRLAQGLAVDDALQGLAPAAISVSALFFEKAPVKMPAKLFPSLTLLPTTPVRITPVISPENFYPTVKSFLGSATRSIRIEQQYIRGDQPVVQELLQQIKTACQPNPKLDVRIIVSPAFLYGAKKESFQQSMTDFDLAFDANYRYLSSKHFVHCHNKLIIVDEEKVLLGSQNWSTTGITSNREASLLVEHAGVAAYFANIFDADWALSEPTEETEELSLADVVARIVQPTEFANGSIMQSAIGDYLDV
jgi:phosphatidylserine/phosphatidylglycerophosphate/cardiolipin synthase-like enzyme